MALRPDQVNTRANSDISAIELIYSDALMEAPARMAAIVAIAEAYARSARSDSGKLPRESRARRAWSWAFAR